MSLKSPSKRFFFDWQQTFKVQDHNYDLRNADWHFLEKLYPQLIVLENKKNNNQWSVILVTVILLTLDSKSVNKIFVRKSTIHVFFLKNIFFKFSLYSPWKSGFGVPLLFFLNYSRNSSYYSLKNQRLKIARQAYSVTC